MMYLRIRHACLLLVAFLAIDFGSAFVPGAAFQRITTTTTTTTATTTTRAFQSATRGTSLRRLWMTSTAAEDETTVNISDMRLSEIQSELKRLNVSSKDCFDRESLTARLLQARPLGKTQVTKEAVVDDNEAARASEPTATTRNPTSETTGSTQTNVKSTDTAANTKSTVAKDAELKQQLKEQVAALSVRELRQELAASGKRWAGMLEKRDLVQAVVDCRLATADFSVSGKMQPGQVADLTDQELTQELQSEQTLILLDVYATWCGPCQMMVPHLQGTAKAFGSRVRVGKLDSDKYAQAAGKWKVQGLPTLLLLRGEQVVDRIEGMVTEEQLVPWVERHL